MSHYGVKRISDIDYDIFEHNGLDDASVILEVFKKKNKKIMNIFPDDGNTNDELFDVNRSYGLLLDNKHNGAPSTSGSLSSSDKENNKTTSSRRTSQQMKELSPVSIHEASSQEEISEPRPKLGVKMPNRRNTPNISLRKSLFTNKRPSHALTSGITESLLCSTPMPNNRPSIHQDSFIQDDVNISPIANNKQKGDRKSVSLAEFDDELRKQYDIHQPTTPRKTRKSICEVVPSTPPKEKEKSLKVIRPSSVPLTNSKQHTIAEVMDISTNTVYSQKSQLRGTIAKNRTDVRAVSMDQEPPIRSKSDLCDSVLAKKLQNCEMTDDSEEEEVDPKTPQKSLFLKPATPKTPSDDSSDTSSLNSSSQKVIPRSTIQSFRDQLRRQTVSEPSQSLITSSSSNAVNNVIRVNRPSKRRTSKIPTENSEKATEYFKYTNKPKKSKKNKEKEVRGSKRRVLYSQHTSMEEETPSASSSTSSVVQKASVEEIFKANDKNVSYSSDSESDSNNLVKKNLEKRYESKAGPLSSKTKEEQKKQKELRKISVARKSQKQQDDHEESTEIQETPKTSRKNRKTKEKIIEEVSEPSESSESQQISQNNKDVEEYVQVMEKRLTRSRKQQKGQQQKQQVIEEVTQEQPDSTSEMVVSKPSKKVQKPSRKRKIEEESQEQSKARRRIVQKSPESDEGFLSNEDDFDVIYVPDTDRYSLRKRRLGRPWWLPNAPSNMRIKHEVLTVKEIKAERKIKELVKRSKINPLIALKEDTALFLAPTEKLKQLKKIEMEKKRAKSVIREGSVASSHISSEKPPPISSRAKGAGRTQLDAISEVSERSTFSNFSSVSDAIGYAFKQLACDEGGSNKVIDSTGAYDISQLDRIDWIACTNGVSFYGFMGTSGDGLLKIAPHSQKSTARTKESTLKFFIIVGDVKFIINDEEKPVQNLGYVVIRPGNHYRIQNDSDHDAIISFARYDPATLNSKN